VFHAYVTSGTCWKDAPSPFTSSTNRSPVNWAMQSRQLSYMAEFMVDVRHIPGTENIVADALSQLLLAAFTAATGSLEVAAVAACPVILDYANQRTCQETLKAASSILPAAAPRGHAGAGVATHPCDRSQRCLQSHPQTDPSWHMCHQAAYDSLIVLEWHFL
jgi:hypothetical protein